ncbi:heavy metal translocating P-type ATPase [Exiguobacterium flavidum]|uniref:heavy metal translocating P-type ATPase n=1 Tax=Exiguobacterium flavidum TaxID=2184695 RepID=UPI000DF85793
MERQKEKVVIKGIDCANCAAKVERGIQALDGVAEANLDFAGEKLFVTYQEGSARTEVYPRIIGRVKELEPGVTLASDQDEKTTNQHVHSHEHDHDHFGRGTMIRYGIGVVAYASAFLAPTAVELYLFLIAYALIGGDVVVRAVRNIRHGQVFDENFLMVIATLGAFAIGEYAEGVAVMLFYQIGEYFQHRAVDQSRKSIAGLMDIRPDRAMLEDGTVVSPESVSIGTRIVVLPGERIPLDGRLLEGEALVDTAALTGESVPRRVREGDSVLGGFVNTDGRLLIEVEKTFGQSTVAKILDLVENASSRKAKTEQFITRFARVYTPAVVVIAALLAFVPPLILDGATFSDWIYRALVFLVISCPCALVISIPLGFFGGIGAASKRGVLVKGGNYLEALNDIDTVVFDKTGTLTHGVFEVTALHPRGVTESELLEVAAQVEHASNHPIARSIMKEYGKDIDKTGTGYREVAGSGIEATFPDGVIRAGNGRWFRELGLSPLDIDGASTVVHVARDGAYLGAIEIADRLKDDVKETLLRLKDIGIRETIMLTGDRNETAQALAERIGIDRFYAELLPDQKVERLEEILARTNGKKVAFVGDGINDAPVLARADLGIAMGGLGSDAAIEAADIVLMTDEPKKLIDALDVARKTRRIVYQNIGFAFGVKLIFLALGAFGIATMWEAVFADVGVTLLAVLNAMRILRK